MERIAIASPCDFVRAPAAQAANGTPLPYCFDFGHARALYVTGVDVEQAKAAPFYYLYLRRHAQNVVSVPIEHGSLACVSPVSDPVFLFSPGRCGSTLLSQVLAEANVRSVSEPDFYTQLASLVWSSPLNPARGVFLKAMWNMSDDLSTALGGAPVVKLRAECARAPELFVRQKGARSIVMFRGFEDWARSTARVFGAGPEKAVQKYLAALHCYARLSRISRCQVVRYEDWVADPLAAAEELGRFLGVTIPAEAVRNAASAPSQDSTPLAGRTRRGWQAKFDGAMQLWGSPRLVSARERLEIPNLWG